MTRVVVAVDSFKGSIGAADAAVCRRDRGERLLGPGGIRP